MTYTDDSQALAEEQNPGEDESSNLSEEQIFKRSRWYAVQVASGCEKRVKLNLEQRVQTLDVANRILDVQIPETPILRHQKDGKNKEVQEKVFPGYVLIRMLLDDEVWQVIKNTPNVINFVGSEQKRRYGRGRGHVKPMPLGPGEVDRIFKRAKEQEAVQKVDLEAGDKITVLSGPFKDFEGEVIEVAVERSKLKALLSIFGRDTPVELEFTQVQKIE
jgi:transcription termination/antitermination protein NusG